MDARDLVEIGWVLVEPIPDVDRRAVEQARAQVLAYLSSSLPRFSFRMPELSHPRQDSGARITSVDLVDQASIEREAKHWDFAIVVTNAELTSHVKPYALGVTARSVAVAALSTLRIDPEPLRESTEKAHRTEVIARRLASLFLVAFARLNGVELSMPDNPAALDADHSLDEAQREDLERALDDVADLRIEESPDRPGRAAFYLRALRRNLSATAGVVLQARPWEFPWRLSRLTGAALSAMLILIVTAEAWDLAMSRDPLEVFVQSATALLGTTIFVVRRQQLLIRKTQRLMEQTVVANVAATVIVALGMLTTYALLFATTFAFGQVFFDRALVLRWAVSLDGSLGPQDHLVFAGFVASLGIIIGALGASFEEQSYFRHVARIDAEI